MEKENKEARLPGFTAELCVEQDHGAYGYLTGPATSPEGVSVATFCWDPYRKAWVFC